MPNSQQRSHQWHRNWRFPDLPHEKAVTKDEMGWRQMKPRLKRLLKALTHRMRCKFAMISLQICIALGLHTACEFVAKIAWPWPTQWKPSVCMWGNSSHTVFTPKPVFVPKCVCTKNHLCRQFTQLLNFWVYNNNGRSINWPCMTVICSMGQARYDVQR